MNQKMVFFDIDGTLLNENKEIPASTKEAVKELQQRGVYVAIATGRAPFMFEDLLRELSINSYVSFNGQYVVFNGDVIYQNPLKRSTLLKLEKEAMENGHPMAFLDQLHVKVNVPYHQFIERSMGSLKMEHPEYDLNFQAERDIYQALLFIEQKDEPPYINKYDDVSFVRWHEVSTDIIPKGGSKAEGIKKIIERLGISRNSVFAFGDGLNDLEMLRFVGNGVAMGNALGEVKDVADYVTKDVGEDGIWHGLKMLNLL